MTCEIHQKIKEYEGAAQDLRRRLRQVEDRKRILIDSLRIMDAPVGDPLWDMDPDPPTVDLGLIDGSYQVGGIKTKMYLEAARGLAGTTGSRVHVADVVRDVLEQGLSAAKPSSLRATIHKTLRRHPEWKYVDNGTFQYLGPSLP